MTSVLVLRPDSLPDTGDKDTWTGLDLLAACVGSALTNSRLSTERHFPFAFARSEGHCR